MVSGPVFIELAEGIAHLKPPEPLGVGPLGVGPLGGLGGLGGGPLGVAPLDDEPPQLHAG